MKMKPIMSITSALKAMACHSDFKIRNLFAIISAIVVIFAGSAQAASFWWDQGGGDGNWSVPNNWATMVVGGDNPAGAPTTGDTVYFNANYTAGQISSLNGNQAALALVFRGNSATSITLANNTLTLGTSGITVESGAAAHTINSAITLGGNQSWLNNSANLFTVGGNIAGVFTLTVGGTGNTTLSGTSVLGAGSVATILTKTGNGTLTLSGANLYTGATTVSGGILKLNNAGALGASSGVTINNSGVLDLNGQTTARPVTISGAGQNGGGALISSSGTGILTGTAALGAASAFPGGVTINNSTGLTGNFLLNKIGSGTLTIADSTTTSGRTGVNQIDSGTLREQSPAAIAPLGTGAYTLNGGTLSLGFNAASSAVNPVNVLVDSTIIADRASSGAGGITITRNGALTIGGKTLTVQPGANVTSSTIGLTLGAPTIGGASLAPGNPTFDVQSTASAANTLTLGALSDQGIAPRTITFTNSSAVASAVTLNTASAAGMLVDGTVINLNAGASAGIQLNVGVAGNLGTLAQVNLASNGANVATLNVGAAQTIGSLAGNGTVALGTQTLTIGNTANSSAYNTTFSGVLGTAAAGVLIKNTTSTLTLSGSSANLFTGNTTLNTGTLILDKTGVVAIPTTGTLALGAAAASSAGNVVLRLKQSNQINPAIATITMNAGSTLDLYDGSSQTMNAGTLGLTGGANVIAGGTGGGTFILGTGAITMTWTGANTVSANLQLTSSVGQTRTITLTGVTDSMAVSGRLTEGSAAGALTKAGAGLMTITGNNNNNYTGVTTVNGGVLNIRDANALGGTAGNTTVSAATLQLQGGITTAAEPLTLNGTGYAGSAGINIQRGVLVNMSDVNNYAGLVTLAAASTISSDSGTLNLTSGTALAGGATLLTLTGAGDGNISSGLGASLTSGLTKNGTGTWTLKGTSANTGTTTISAGTLKLGDGTSGSWSSTPALTFSLGSGTFELAGLATGQTQGLGALTFTSGEGTVKIDVPGTSGNNQITFASLAATAAGASGNFVSPSGSPGTKVVFTSAPTVTKGVISAGTLFFNGADFASYGGGAVIAATYTDQAAALAAGAGQPTRVTGDFTQGANVAVDSGIKFDSARTLTIGNTFTITIQNAANSAAGVLVTGGNAVTIADAGSATGLTTGGSGTLVLRTDTSSDTLTIGAKLTAGTTGGIAKTGAGTVTLNAANLYTGTTYVDSGTLKLGNATAMNNTAVTVQIGGVLDLNGQTITNTITLNGTGISGTGALINSSGTLAGVGPIIIGAGFNSTATGGAIGSSIGGANQITSTATGGVTGNYQLNKVGAGTLIITGATSSSGRTGVNQIDAGTLRLQVAGATAYTPIGTGAFIMNGGTLSLGFDVANALFVGGANIIANSTIIADRNTSGAGGIATTLGVLNFAGPLKLTVQGGANVASSTAGLTFGATTLQGNPTFDVQNPTTGSGSTLLTLGALNDLGFARTIAFTNSGATGSSSLASAVTLGTAAASLVDGTVVNVNAGANKGITLNLNTATGVLGSLAQVNLANNGANKATLNLGIAQTIGSLSGNGNVTGAFGLTIGNVNNASVLSTDFTGVLGAGSVATALTKAGNGTLTLSGANLYTGATTVSGGILKLNNASALGSSSGVTINNSGVLDLNGQSTVRPVTISGVGQNGGGALTSSSGTGTLTGTAALGAVSSLTGAVTINNTTGLTGNYLLRKIGAGTLTIADSTTTSTRNGVNQIDAGTLRLQSSSASSITPIGTGAFTLNGGTLSLGFNVANAANTGAVYPLVDSTIIVDRETAGAGGINHTLGALNIGGQTLTIQPGANVTSGTIGLTLLGTTIGGAAQAPGNPIFDVKSTVSAAMTLTLGALSDQGIAPRTITFQNSSAVASAVTLSALATSLVDGTVVNVNAGANAGIQLNVGVAGNLGTLAQVNLNNNGANVATLNVGAAQTIGSLSGNGNVIGANTLTIGNAANSSDLNTTFSGVIGYGGVATVLTKAGNGTLTLTGANAYTGITTISAGTIQISAANNIGGGGAGNTISLAGTLASTANTYDLGVNRTIALTSNDATIRVDADALTVSGIISGGFNLNKTGTGTLVLSGANSFNGGLTVKAGTVKLGATTGAGAGLVTLGVQGDVTSGTLDLNGAARTIVALSTAGTAANQTITSTTAGGVLNYTSATSSTFGGVIAGGANTEVTINNAGASLTLTGTSTYSGATTVTAGKLFVNGSGSLASGSAVTVANGATLGGNGSINGTVTASAGANLAPGASVGTIGMLTLANTLTLNSANLNFDITSATTPGTTYDQIVNTGSLVVNGVNVVYLNFPSGAAAGTYMLITCSGTPSGSIVFPNGLTTMGNASLALVSGGVQLTVAAGGLNKSVWRGNGSVWDTATTANWTRNGTGPAQFQANDLVTFDNTGIANLTVTGAGSPDLVTVDSTSSYIINANIGGTGALIKNNSGQLTLGGTSTYSGGTILNAGQVNFTADANFGDANGDVTFNGAVAFNRPGTSGFTFGAGRTFTINAGATLTWTSGNSGQNFNGILTGAGSIINSSSTGINFNNTANNFTGRLDNGYETQIASIGDSSNPINLIGSNSRLVWIASTGARTLTNRVFTLQAAGTGVIVANGVTASDTLRINQSLAITGAAGARGLTLDGSNAGINIFAGNITDGVGSSMSVVKAGTTSWTISGNVSGATTSVRAGTAGLTLSGTNTYSGITGPDNVALTIKGKDALSPNSTISFDTTNGSAGQGGGVLNLRMDDVGVVSLGNRVDVKSLQTSAAGQWTIDVRNNGGATTGSTLVLGKMNFNGSFNAGTSSITMNVTGANSYRLQFGDVDLSVSSTGNQRFNPTSAPLTITGTVKQVNGKTGSNPLGADTLVLDGTATGNLFSSTSIIADALDYTNLSNANAKPLNILKSNTSTWTLSGTNTYSGATTISGGKLVVLVGSSCSNSAVTVSGGTLSVSVTDITKQWTSKSLRHIAASTLEFAFGTIVPSTTVAPLMLTENASFDFSPTVSCTGNGLIGLPPGLYPLMKWTGAMSGMTPSSVTLSSGSGTLIRDDANKTLWLNILSSNASKQPLTWRGPTTSTWVANEAVYTKWQDATLVNTNYQESIISGVLVGDSVVFGDTGAGTVTLNTTNSPASILVNSTANYTFSGSGNIGGIGGLTKANTGTLTLSMSNSYSGGTRLSAGILSIGINDALGTGSVVLGGGTIQSTDGTARTLNNPLVLGGDFIVGGTGNLAFSNTGNSVLGATRQITVNSGRTATFAQAFSGSGAGITKAGAGTLKLTGNNSIGPVTVTAGLLTIDGGTTSTGTFALPNASVSIVNGGTLSTVSGGAAAAFSSGSSLTVTGGNGMTSTWNLNGGDIGTTAGSSTTGTFLIDGAGYAGSARVINVGILSWGRTLSNASLILTNGGRMSVNGEIRTGNPYYNTTGNSDIIIGGGTATSTLTGNNQAFYIGYPERNASKDNDVIVSSGGVLTGIGNMFVGNVAYGTALGTSMNNKLTVDGTGTASMASVTVGYANVNVDAANANLVVVSNGGQLTTSANSYIGRAITGAVANNNTATVAGSLNGTNALWNLGGQTLYVGFAAGTGVSTGNVLTVGTGGVLTNLSGLVLGATNTFYYNSADAMTMSCIISGGGVLIKDNSGTLSLSNANTYTGTTKINGGKLLINGNQTSATNTVSVSALATLGGTGTIGGSTTIADTGKLEFNISTATGSHDKLDLAAGKSLTFLGASTLTITSSGGASVGNYTLVTAPGTIIGVVPATVILPAGWEADAPLVVGNDLKINITKMPVISTSGTLTGMTTTYGTASAAQSFNVSGADMAAGITVTPPAGFEASTTSDFSSNVGNNASPITVGSSGIINSTPVYLRLATTSSVVGSPYSGNIICSSAGASSVNVATVSSTVSPKALTIGAPTVTKGYNGLTTPGTVTVGALSGFVGSETVTATGTATAYSAKDVGTSYAATVSYTLANGTSGGLAANYSLANSDINNAAITKVTLSVTADNKSRLRGEADPILTYTIAGYQNGEDATAAGLTGAPTLSTTADGASPVGTYEITCVANNLAADNYDFSYFPGTLTVNPSGTLFLFMAE